MDLIAINSVVIWAFLYACINQSSPEKQNQQDIHFKELAHEILEADKSKICRVRWQTGGPGKSRHCSSSLQALLAQSLFFRGGHSFVLFKP